MASRDPRYHQNRRAARHAQEIARLNDLIPAECPLTITGGPIVGEWRFYTNTGKGPLRFEVAAAYITGYLAAWTEAR